MIDTDRIKRRAIERINESRLTKAGKSAQLRELGPVLDAVIDSFAEEIQRNVDPSCSSCDRQPTPSCGAENPE